MQRYPCDLSHYSFDRGAIGSLMTMATIPVVAGDSMSVDLEGVFRLSPLRRNLIVDAHVDLFAFFVPHRHVYGEDWIDFIKEGKNEIITFQPVSMPANISYLGAEMGLNENAPLWLVAGYNQIWNRYFRSPTDVSKEYADTFVTADVDERVNGYRCGYLPQPWSTGVDNGVVTTERDVPVVLDTLDIVELNRVQAQYKTEVEREYFGQRYNDLLNTTFGATVNTDADERPTLLARNTWWLSGYDVDGTSDATLGSYSGKSAGVGTLRMRRKFFAEHGALRIMALMRFPSIHVEERHHLVTTVNPSYLEIAGDPSLIAAEPPVDLLQIEFFRQAAALSLGVGPYGQWYRYQPNHVHRTYLDLDGFTFIDEDITSRARAWYHVAGEYDDVFQTTQLGHWQGHSRINVKCNRVVPPARTSLFAGA